MKILKKLATIRIPLDALVSMVNNDGKFAPDDFSFKLPDDAVAVGVEVEAGWRAVSLVVASESFKENRPLHLYCLHSFQFRERQMWDRLQVLRDELKSDIEAEVHESVKPYLERAAEHIRLAINEATGAHAAACYAAEAIDKTNKRKAAIAQVAGLGTLMTQSAPEKGEEMQ